MKRLASLAALAVALAAAPASADVIKKGGVIQPPPPSPWTGFYLGLNAGYNWGLAGSTVTAQVNPANWSIVNGVSAPAAGPQALGGNASTLMSGFLGGAQIGYNYTVGSSIVVGFETDIQGTSIRGTAATMGSAASVYGLSSSVASARTGVAAGLDYLGTVRVRAGYLITPKTLVYGTGGFTYGGAYSYVTQGGVENMTIAGLFPATAGWLGAGQQSTMLTGWNGGGGIEMLLGGGLSAKLEGTYWNLGNMSVQTTAFGVSPAPNWIGNAVASGTTTVPFSGVAARAGVNYHLDIPSIGALAASFGM